MKINKQKFLSELFEIKSYWVKDEKRSTGIYTVKCDGNDEGAYLKTNIEIVNAGIWRAVENQVNIYRETLEEDETRGICREIIIKAVDKYEIKENTRQGEEINRLCSYILTCIKTEIQNHIKGWTESERSRKNGEENVYSPAMLESTYQLIPDNEGNEIELINMISNEQNFTYRNDEYVKTDTLKAIEKTIEDELTEYEKEILNLLAITNNNNVKTGKLLKEIDIGEGKKLRSSDEAYRIHTKRQKDKIIKKINDNIDVKKVTKINKQKKEKQQIQDFLRGDTTNIKVIEYVKNNLEKEFMLDILYDELNDGYRRYLIRNFIHNYNEDKLFAEMTKKVCGKIIQELYKYIKVIDFNLRSNDIRKKDVKIEATQPAPQIPEIDIDTKTYLYIREDKYTKEYKKKCIKRGIKTKMQGQKIIHGDKYYLIYINKNKEGMDWKQERKTQYHTIDLYGNIF
ncbi:hypothetical protein [Anaerosalibacter massiliensis]|uniref:hypothetical protein n=1 Tax=Anaerosalibacter massiliensis TaxID=1347392 RepID=UPI0005B268DE|nr:hypothetical protein [Anaerosalibacter massiliensis]